MCRRIEGGSMRLSLGSRRRVTIFRPIGGGWMRRGVGGAGALRPAANRRRGCAGGVSVCVLSYGICRRGARRGDHH